MSERYNLDDALKFKHASDELIRELKKYLPNKELEKDPIEYHAYGQFEFNEEYYDLILIAEDNIEDEGKYQNGGTHYQLVSYDPNITNYSSEESITSYYDIEVYIGYYRTGSYYTDWFYTYDIPTIHRIVIEEVAEVIIPAHKEVRTYQFGKLIKDID